MWHHSMIVCAHAGQESDHTVSNMLSYLFAAGPESFGRAADHPTICNNIFGPPPAVTAQDVQRVLEAGAAAAAGTESASMFDAERALSGAQAVGSSSGNGEWLCLTDASLTDRNA